MIMGSSMSAASPHLPCPPVRWVPSQKARPTPNELTSTAASLRLGFLLRSSFQKLTHVYRLRKLEDLWLRSTFGIDGISASQFLLFPSTFACSFFFFNGEGPRKGAHNEGTQQFESSKRQLSYGRKWTNLLLAVNVLIYAAQIASQGELLTWGAKINSLIDKGQIWRLVTSSLLHANIWHLMVNCFSLNSIGPTVENLTGPRRFLAVYFTSAITSSMTSYRLCKAPAVGASGAIFGLVGSAAVFVMRHRGMIRGGKEDLQYMAQVIFVNMVIGILSKGIDNWGHVGGLLGGIATSWLLGPSWKYQYLSDNRTRIFIDRAPIKYLTNRKRIPDNRN